MRRTIKSSTRLAGVNYSGITEFGIGWFGGGAITKALKGASFALRGGATTAKAVQGGNVALRSKPWMLKAATDGVVTGAAVTA